MRPTELATPRTDIALRPWQGEAAAKALEWWNASEQLDGAVIHAVMGAGKTHLTGVLAETWRRSCEAGQHVIILVPTKSLVEQTAMDLRRHWCGPKVGTYYALAKDIAQVIVTTYDSAAKLSDELQRARRAVRFVMADECHQTENPRGHTALDAMRCPVTLGLSATPYRSDRKQNLRLFDKVLYKYGPADALRDGFLVPFDTIPAAESVTEHSLDDICLRMAQEAVQRGPTVINAVSIPDAEDFAARLSAQGIPAKAVHSKLAGTVHDPSSALGQRIRWLEMGRVKALVYPSLLSEGVNLPWLTCLVARRLVRSRVRFAQEVGRMLRAHDGKRLAYLYDPHDLSHSLGLDYDAALGWQEEQPEELLHDALDAGDRERIRELGERFEDLPQPKKLSLAEVFARRLANAWRQVGRMRPMATHAWRTMEPTPKHAAAIARNRNLAERVADGEMAVLLHAALDSAQAGELDRGTTGDLLEVLWHIRDHGRVWPMEMT